MADCLFQAIGKFALLKVIALSFFNGFLLGRWQTLIEHLKSNIIEEANENFLLFCRNLQANGHNFSGTPCIYRVSQEKHPEFERLLLPEYIINDILQYLIEYIANMSNYF